MPHATRRSEFLAGVRAELPLLLGVAPFGMAYGAYAVESGLSKAAAQAMSVIVLGGASQFVAVRLVEAATPGAIVVLAIALVNMRHMLYSASVAPYIEHLGLRWRLLLGYVLTDEAYVVAIQRYREPGDASLRHWYLLGAEFALWSCWQVTTAGGVFLGAAVPDGWSLDFALPLTFIAIVVPALRERPALAAALVAAIVGTAAFRWPYSTGLFTAAAAGLAAGMMFDRAAVRARGAA